MDRNDINNFTDSYNKTINNENFKLYINLFSNIITENNISYKLVKCWFLLETLADYTNVNYKKDKVKTLFADHDIYNPTLENGKDLVDLLYICRNLIVHEGDINLSNLGSEYSSFKKEFKQRVLHLQNTTKSIINQYKYYYTDKK